MIYYNNAPQEGTNAITTLQTVLYICCHCLPVRFAALHVVQVGFANDKTSSEQHALPVFWRNLAPTLQVRTAFHFVKSPDDLKKELQRFGIRLTLLSGQPQGSPPGAIDFPVDGNGTMQLQRHWDWLRSVAGAREWPTTTCKKNDGSINASGISSTDMVTDPSMPADCSTGRSVSGRWSFFRVDIDGPIQPYSAGSYFQKC